MIIRCLRCRLASSWGGIKRGPCADVSNVESEERMVAMGDVEVDRYRTYWPRLPLVLVVTRCGCSLLPLNSKLFVWMSWHEVCAPKHGSVPRFVSFFFHFSILIMMIVIIIIIRKWISSAFFENIYSWIRNCLNGFLFVFASRSMMLEHLEFERDADYFFLFYYYIRFFSFSLCAL